MTMTRRRLLDNTLKKTVVGNPAIATDSLARMYPGIEMQGWTTQDGTPTPEAPVPIVSAGTQNQETGKWEYEVEVLGGNFWSKDQNAEFIASKNFSFNTPIPEGEYIFSSIVHSTDTDANQNLILINMENGKTLYYNIDRSEDNERVDVAVKITSPCVSILLYASISYSTSAGETALFSDIMINLGNTALPYEPYRTPQTVTLTADRPLTKWDRLEKRNGQWGWVYKSEEIESYTDGGVPGEYFSTTGQLSVGAQVWYETATETFVPLTASEQEAMNTLYTYRPTTVLSNQQDCDMTLTYKTRKGMN